MTCDHIRQEILKVEPLAHLQQSTDESGDLWLEWVLSIKRLGFICSAHQITWYYATKGYCNNGTLLEGDLPNMTRWML